MSNCDWLMANLLIVLLASSLACIIAWLLVDLRRKNYIGLLLGLLSTCLLLGSGYRIYVVDRFYDRDAMANVILSASQALQKGKTEVVVSALDDYVTDFNHPSGSYSGSKYYDARNRLWLRLNEEAKHEEK
jgi:hypothetical protein